MASVIKCDGCGKVSKDEWPDGWVRIKGMMRLEVPEETVSGPTYYHTVYDKKGMKITMHFCSVLCAHDNVGRVIVDEYLDVYPSLKHGVADDLTNK